MFLAHNEVVKMAEAKVAPMTSIIRPRQRERKHYTEDCMNDEEIEGKRMFSVEEKLVSDKFQDLFVKEMTGEELNMKHIQENGFTCPVVIKDKTGLGMRLPSKNFTVNDVRQCVGSRRMLDVMDVTTQKDIEMSMKDWVKYYENPAREKLLNVISLEFSHTKLENYVESPRVVRDIDWVDCVWPRHLKLSQTESTNIIDDMKYPKVQKYCLMSVRGCYTDFHIDFGGTSVWYHILHGRKVFWLIPPSEKNIQLYEQWVLSGKQGDVFFGDTVEECGRIELEEGWTFFIPTGWIHAVYTPRDSLVFGGNFLHSFGVDKQLRIAQVEDVTRVPNKFRYPFYTEILWYLLERYVHCLMGSSHLKNQDDGGGGCQESPLHSKSSSNWSTSGGQERVKPASVAAIQEGVPEILGQEQQPTMLLAKGDQSNMPDRDSEGKENCWQQWQGTPDGIAEDPDAAATQSGRNPRAEIVKKPHVHLTKLEVKGLKAIMQWLSQLPPHKRNVPELLKDPERLLMDVQIVIDEHLNDDPQLAATGKYLLAWPDLPKKIKPKSRSGGSSKSSSKSGSNKGDKNANGARRRRTRCKKCEACMRADCGECHFCKDMKKFGGPGRMKQSCISRQCMAPVLPHTACCMVCGKDGWEKAGAAEEEEASSLMECSVCWEIVHPDCLWLRISVDHSDGVVNEDLPNSWECPKCCLHGKNSQNKQIRPPKNGRHKPAESTTGAVEDCPREGWEASVMSGSGPMWTAKRETVAALDENLVDNFTKKKVKLESDSLVESPTMASFESIDRLQGSVKKHVQPSADEARRKRRTNSDASPGGKQRRPEGEAHIRSCTRLLEPEISSLEPFVRTPKILQPESTASSPKDKNMRRAKPVVEKTLLPCQVKVLKCDTVVGGSQRRPGPGSTGPSPKRSTRTPDDHVAEEPGSTREKRMPLYVVRPAPVAESLKDRTRQGHLSAGNSNMALDRDVMMCVLRFLQPEDLCRCMQVCKVWNGWCLEKRLWTRLDLTQRKITSRHLMGIVRRQPASLSLGWTNISKKLLAWLVSRLPQLCRLDLSGCSWSAAMALRTCNCPTLQALDLGWTEGLTDGHLRELLTPPPDSRPGLLESKSRLRNLVELRLAGCEVGDVSLRYITQHLRTLAKLDVSHCIKMSDAGVALLAAVGSPTRDSLQVLDMSGCKRLTDTCLEHLKRCERLSRIDLRHCPEVSVVACRKYIGSAKEILVMVEAKLIEKERNHRL